MTSCITHHIPLPICHYFSVVYSSLCIPLSCSTCAFYVTSSYSELSSRALLDTKQSRIACLLAFVHKRTRPFSHLFSCRRGMRAYVRVNVCTYIKCSLAAEASCGDWRCWWLWSVELTDSCTTGRKSATPSQLIGTWMCSVWEGKQEERHVVEWINKPRYCSFSLILFGLSEPLLQKYQSFLTISWLQRLLKG